MSKVVNPFKKLKNIGKLKQELDDIFEDDLHRYVLTRYEEITAPFETNFTFEIDATATADGFRLNVRPEAEFFERSDTNPDRGSVHSWVLFNTLDLGSSDTAKVYLPDDFENESAPNSLGTSSKAYSRNAIYANGNESGQSMEARNWSKLLVEEYEARRFVKPRSLFTTAVRKVFGD